MNKKQQEVLNRLLNYIESYKNEIDIFAVYFSNEELVDQELPHMCYYYVPKKDSNFNLNLNFVYQNQGYHLERMSYDIIDDVINYKNHEQYKLIDSTVLFYKDENTLNHFQNLIESIYNFSDFDKLVENEIMLAKLSLFDIHNRHYKIFNHLFNALVYSKKSNIKHGIINFEEELESLEVPKKMIKLLKEIYIESSVERHKKIILDIKNYVLPKNNVNLINKDLDSLYQRLINLSLSLLNEDDLVKRFLFIEKIQEIIDTNIFDSDDFVQRLHQTSDDDEIIDQMEELYNHLLSKGIEINHFDTIDELDGYLIQFTKNNVN